MTITSPNHRIEPMTRSAMTPLFQSSATDALLVMAHPCRSAAFRAHRWSHGSGLAQTQVPLDKSTRCVGEAGAFLRLRSHHGSRQFESGLTMVADRRPRTAMIPWPIQPPNNRVESNRCQAPRLRSWQVFRSRYCGCDGTLTAAVAHPCRWAKTRLFPSARVPLILRS